MPIAGISDIKRLPRVAKIHLGEKKQGQRGEYPSPVPYFLVRADETTPVEAAEAFRKVYGEQPTALRILFPTNNPEDWSDQHYRLYGQSYGLTCKGTGETAQAKWDTKRNTWADRETKEPWEYRTLTVCGELCPMLQTKKCKAVMRLSFLLPDVPGLGIWQLDTGSVNSMINVNGMVQLVKEITGGHLAFFPFVLHRHQITVQPKGEKAKSVYILDLRPDGVLTFAQARALAAASGEIPVAMLPEPDEGEAPDDLFQNGEGEPADVEAPEDAEPAPSAATDVTNSEPPLRERVLKTVNDLTKAAQEDYELNGKQVYDILGVKSSIDIGDLQAAWAKVVAHQE